MTTMKCPNCGSIYEYIEGKGYICPYCGHHGSDIEISQTVIDKLDKANSLRERYYFKESLDLCNNILMEEPNNQEANWCALLAEYRVVYLQNDKREWTATFLNPEAISDPMSSSPFASKLNRVQHDALLKIEEQRRKAIEDSAKIPPYDVFISYKQHKSGSSNILTDEAKWAEDLYNTLTKKKLRVFFDKQSLGGRIGWEAHIFSAIRSAKYMIVFGSTINNIEAPWVKNEWSRFAYMQESDRSKRLQAVVSYKAIPDLMKLDSKLRNSQVVNVDVSGWQNELVKDIVAVVNSSASPVYLLHEEAQEAIRHGKFKTASPNHAKTY